MGRNKSEFKVIKGGRRDRVLSKRVESKSKGTANGKKPYRGSDTKKTGGVVGNRAGSFFVYVVIILALVGVASWVTGRNASDVKKMTMTERIEKTMVDEYGLSTDVRVVSAPMGSNSKDVELTGTWYVSSADKMYVYMRDDTTKKHALYEMGEEVKQKISKK